MKISVNNVKIILGGIAGCLIAAILGYGIFHWQYYVIMIPAAFVIIKWTDIFYKIHRSKGRYNNARN